HLIELAVVVPAALEGLARRLVHALFIREVLAHDGRQIHLRVGDSHRLDLDVVLLHQLLNDFTGDDRDDFGVQPHEQGFTWLDSIRQRKRARISHADHSATGDPASSSDAARTSSSSIFLAWSHACTRSATAGPTASAISSMVASRTRFTLPKCLSSVRLRPSPTPGMCSSSLARPRFLASFRWKVIAKRCASSRRRVSMNSSGLDCGSTMGS